MNNTIGKYIYYSIIIGAACNVVRIYFQQRDALENFMEQIYPWYYQVGFLGNVFMCFAAIGSFFLYRKYFPSYITNCYLLMILWVTIASINDFGAILKSPNFFFSIKGIGTFINFGLLYFAADTERFPKVLKFFYFICFFFILAAFLNLAKMGGGASRKEYLTSISGLAFYCIWVFPYFFLQEEENKKKNLINLGTFGIIILLILFTGARSYLLISALYLMLKFSKTLKSKNGIATMIGLGILSVAGYIIFSSSGMGDSVESAMTNLSERSGEDTRSEQIMDFLSQYDTEYLIQGVGPLGLWFWHGINDFYGFLDNQFLLLAWWAGLPAILTYIFFLVKSLTVESEILYFEKIKGIKLIIGLWIGACLGFAIYVTISSDLYYFFISFMIGLNACQYTKIIDPEEQLEAE